MSTPARQASRQIGYLYASVTVFLWACFVIFTRLAGESGLGAFDLAALRFGVAAIFLLPVWLFWRRAPLFNRQMLALAAAGGIGYPLSIYVGIQHSSAAHGAVLLSGTLPFSTALMAWLVLHESIGRRRFRALLIIALGVTCVGIYSMSNLSQTWQGDLMILSSSLFWALYAVLVQRWCVQPWDVTVGTVLLCALIYLPIYVLWLPKTLPTASAVVIITQGFFQGVMMVIVAMLCYMKAQERLGTARTSAMIATVPSVAGIGAVLVLHEPFTWLLLGGLLLTSLGAWLSTR